MISTTATRATGILMTAPSAVLTMLVVDTMLMVLESLPDPLVANVVGDCVTVTAMVMVLESIPLVTNVVGDCFTVTARKIENFYLSIVKYYSDAWHTGIVYLLAYT